MVQHIIKDCIIHPGHIDLYKNRNNTPNELKLIDSLFNNEYSNKINIMFIYSSLGLCHLIIITKINFKKIVDINYLQYHHLIIIVLMVICISCKYLVYIKIY